MTNGSPTIFFIFGITGDLAKTKLLPALVHLYEKGLLPEQFHIVGFGRRPWDEVEFKNYIGDVLKDNASFKKDPGFLNFFSYQEGQFDSLDSYTGSAKRLAKIDEKFGQCSNKLFYLAVPPSNYEIIFRNISAAGLSIPCGGKEGWARILVEKPFGSDLATARSLNLLLGELFQEDQIFRIDHYLAKETVRAILAFRRENSLFRSAWDSKHIDKVTIGLFEERVVGARGAFYDAVGALKDVGQNHVLQMLSLIAMELPEKMDASNIREARADVMKELRLSDEKGSLVRAQYEGYLDESGVSEHSATETYFRLQTKVQNDRWKDTLFVLESGKGLSPSEVRIDVRFRPEQKEIGGDTLTFFIQPKEGIELFSRGQKIETFDLVVADTGADDAYEKILLDCVNGDHSLFAGTSEVEAAWKFVGEVLEQWKTIPMLSYPQKSKHDIISA